MHPPPSLCIIATVEFREFSEVTDSAVKAEKLE